MRVGFLTQLLFERYGAFWSALVASAGAVAVYPTRDGVMGHAADVDHDAVPSLSFRLAAVQAASLADCDLIIVPELNPELDSARGSAQDRWVADLAGALADAVPGLPPLVSVAAYPDPAIESRAVSLLQQLVHETGAVTRVWARNRAAAERMTTTIAAPRRGPVARAGLPSAALVGQPWLVTEAVAAAATEAALTGLSMRSVPLDQARAEGLSFDERLIPTDAEVVVGDVRDRAALTEACDGVDAVLHNVAQVPLAKDHELFRSVNVGGTANVLLAARDAGVAKVVSTSSSAIFGIPEANPVTEDTPGRPLEAYGRAKLVAETLCAQAVEAGQDVTVVRPRTILGHGRLGIMAILFEFVAEGAPVFVFGRGDNRYQFVHSSDLADAILSGRVADGQDVTVDAAPDGTQLSVTPRHAAQAMRQSRLPTPSWINLLPVSSNSP